MKQYILKIIGNTPKNSIYHYENHKLDVSSIFYFTTINESYSFNSCSFKKNYNNAVGLLNQAETKVCVGYGFFSVSISFDKNA